MGIITLHFTLAVRGSSSVVEHDLAKVGVAGSTPVFRSSLIMIFKSIK